MTEDAITVLFRWGPGTREGILKWKPRESFQVWTLGNNNMSVEIHESNKCTVLIEEVNNKGNC